jgi:phosphomannomutase
VVRPSGTEAAVRIMAEGDDADLLARVVDALRAELQAAAPALASPQEDAAARQVGA